MFYNILFNNWKIKITSLILALLLVLYISADKFTMGTFPRAFSVEAKNIPPQLQLINQIGHVQLKLRAPTEVWKYISVADFSLYVDLTDAQSGTNLYPIKAQVHNPQIVLLEIIPNLVSISLEELDLKRMPFEIKIQGKPADGFEVGNIEYEKTNIAVTGTKSSLIAVENLIAWVNVNKAQQNLKQNIKILGYDAQDKVVNQLTCSPATVSVTVEIKPIMLTKTVATKAVLSADIAKQYSLANFSLEPQVVVIKGPKNLIDTIQYLETEEITATDLKNISFQKALSTDPEIDIVDHQQSVKVTFTQQLLLTPAMSTQTFSIAPTFKNLPPTLELQALSPATISIVLTGQEQTISNLKENDLSCTIDLSDFKTTGNYVIPLESSLFYIPSGIKIQEIKTSSLAITLLGNSE